MSEVQHHQSDTTLAISLTPIALAHVKKKLAERGKGLGLRLKVETRGCSGLAYVVDYVDAPQADDTRCVIDTEVSVFVDTKSLPYVNGTKLDYVKEGLNEHFTFENPNQKGACGCGESFTV